jgi:hypothetical protein
MRVYLIAALIFLGAAPCLGQSQACPDSQQCQNCGDGDAICCPGGAGYQWTCDCTTSGHGCSGSQICDNGCCITPNCPSGTQPCDGDGNCASGQCNNGCCLACQSSCVANPALCDEERGETCDGLSGCCIQCSQCGDSCCSIDQQCNGAGTCVDNSCDKPCAGPDDCKQYEDEGTYTCESGCCVDPHPCGYCGQLWTDGKTCMDGCWANGTSCQNGVCSNCSRTCTSSCAPGDESCGCPVQDACYNGCCIPTVSCWTGCSTTADCAAQGYTTEVCIDGCCGCSQLQRSMCGPCGWGQLECDGVTCTDDGTCNCNAGDVCDGCGTLQCDGTCSYASCPHQPGDPCGTCGTYQVDQSCNDPCACVSYQGESCGNCGSYQCDGSCNDPCACVPNQGQNCGYCGTVNCDGSCSNPCGCSPDAGQSCGYSDCANGWCWGCPSTYDCNGNCVDTGGCCLPNAGESCGNCGTLQCDASCSDPCS